QSIKSSQHLGCQERLVGPVDNLSSSCLACHAMAEVRGGERPFSAIKYDDNSFKRYSQCRCQADLDHWFKTLKAGEAFTSGAVSLNFSLQLSNGITRYCQHHPENCPYDSERLLASEALRPCPVDPPLTGCPVKLTGAGECPTASPNLMAPAAVTATPSTLVQ